MAAGGPGGGMKRAPGRGRARAARTTAIAIALLAAGLALRLWHIGYGLPDLLDEAIPFKTALRMWAGEGRVDWNPHFFNYPSLTIYLQLLVQGLTLMVGRTLHHYASLADYLTAYETDPTQMVIAARMVGVIADAVTLIAVVRIGERMRRGAGLVAAAVVAIAPTMILTSRAIYTDTPMTAFAVVALERMLSWRATGRHGALIAATVCSGLAAGCKYPAAVLVVPLAWVLLERRGARALPVWALACVAALGVFLISSPYVVLDFAQFRKDFAFESLHMAQGHLGSADRRGFLFQLGTLARDIGWPGLALLGASLAFTLRHPRTHADRAALWLFLLPLGAAISLARVEAERYLMPLIPVAALLAAAAAVDLFGSLGRVRRFAPVLAALSLVLPVLPAGVRTGASGRGDTQAEARRWCESHLKPEDLLLREGYSGELLTRQRVAVVRSSRGFAAAGEAFRRRFLARRTYASVDLPLVVAGQATAVLELPDGTKRRLVVYPHPQEINQIFYDLRLLHGVDYVFTSGAIRGRYQAQPSSFPAQCRLYAFLDSSAVLAARFDPGGDVTGPEIRVYRLGERARAALERLGDLDPLWWAATVPRPYRIEFESVAVPPERRSGGALREPDGWPAPWVLGLEAFFASNVRPFAEVMAYDFAGLGRLAAALPLAEAIHLMRPAEVLPCLAYVTCAGELGAWREANVAIERTLALAREADPLLPYLRLQHGRALSRLGAAAAARGELEWVAGRAEAASDVGREARAELARLAQRDRR